ncbi:hypothetical protein CTAM01_00474 [Colletotrichum tamarilloi]|uniref:Uncharacterized protein n=1 Tax=Colletotrichum tamarilloi TaxID=1209934 RepID=A0ABQ9RUP8_9PEZI|nr:uncharacterized protein CTAM01_00474 [Colletotrichum tamarilloi]KAK1513078.1 hypothetical protein CTAM01_00474 [Colletotrichum tamarilloi]
MAQALAMAQAPWTLRQARHVFSTTSIPCPPSSSPDQLSARQARVGSIATEVCGGGGGGLIPFPFVSLGPSSMAKGMQRRHSQQWGPCPAGSRSIGNATVERITKPDLASFGSFLFGASTRSPTKEWRWLLREAPATHYCSRHTLLYWIPWSNLPASFPGSNMEIIDANHNRTCDTASGLAVGFELGVAGNHGNTFKQRHIYSEEEIGTWKPMNSNRNTHIGKRISLFRLYGRTPRMLLRPAPLLRRLQSGTVSRTAQRLTCSVSPQTLHLIFASDPAAPPRVGFCRRSFKNPSHGLC